MKKGGKRFLVVPPGLAYGAQGIGNRVPANSTLLFDVEVVRVSTIHVLLNSFSTKFKIVIRDYLHNAERSKPNH